MKTLPSPAPTVRSKGGIALKTQKHRFRIVAFLLIALLVLLALYGTFSVTRYGNRWFSSSHNSRLSAQKQNVIEGSILDRNETVLAKTEDGKRIFPEDTEDRKAVVHLLGDREGNISNAIEAFQIGHLYGFTASLPDRIGSLLASQPLHGNDLVLTVDSRLNRALMESFQSRVPGKKGAAVIMNWQTGEIVGFISLPTYDPDALTDAVKKDPDQPFWNRVTQGLYPPGSTFKIITAAAALKSLPDALSFTVDCDGALTLSDGTVIHDFQQEVHRKIGLADAFRLSCNPFFASLALRLGDADLRSAASGFGFGANFLFRDLVVENSVYPSSAQSGFSLATSGIGQSSITATPMHVCLIAASIANGGSMMEPQLIREVRSPAGRTVSTLKPAVYRKTCSEKIAATISGFMKSTVQDGGSGWRAAVNGMDIRGKTGTAESAVNGLPVNYGWFTGFSADSKLPYALCILVEDIPDGQTGGTTSAVIAADAFKAVRDLLSEP